MRHLYLRSSTCYRMSRCCHFAARLKPNACIFILTSGYNHLEISEREWKVLIKIAADTSRLCFETPLRSGFCIIRRVMKLGINKPTN